MKIDEVFVSRLLMGTLSEHEQRLLAVRLLTADPGFRVEVARALRPFEMFDLDLTAEYAEALAEGAANGALRERLLERALERRADLEQAISKLTVSDLLHLGEPACELFTWSCGELLLRRSTRPGVEPRVARVNLYLALMVIDVVDILGAAGHSPRFPAVVDDLRQRIYAASSATPERQG